MTDTPTQPPLNPPSLPDMLGRMGRSFTLRFMLLGMALLLLLIPLFMVWGIIEDRARLQREVVAEIGASWGGPQRIAGPVLVVPTTLKASQRGGADPVRVILPESLDVDVKLTPDLRYRGLYSAVVYNSAITISGNLRWPSTDSAEAGNGLSLPDSQLAVLKSQLTQLYIGVGDTRSLTGTARMTLGGQTIELDSGGISALGYNTGFEKALVARIDAPRLLPPGESVPFTLTLTIKGSEEVSMLPLGRENALRMTGQWKDPSFSGHALPSTREVTADSFTAQWKLAHYGRGFGQSWLTGSANAPDDSALQNTAIRVGLLQPDTSYRLVERAVKYGALIIALTFTLFLLMEMIGGAPIRLYHYALSGVAMILFYLLLLSLSEVIGGNAAYAVATVAVSAQVGLFARSFAGSTRRAAISGGALAGLYGYIYIILRMDSYALLSGTLLLFLALSAIMYATRYIPQQQQP